ncbi:golgin candidate 4 isoform X7 [Triticum aestivum]|nr:golgin candidate 4-like isoform X7 [Triticum aestivum]
MRSSIATYRESLSRLAGEVDDATADEIPAPWPSRRGDHAPTPPSSGRRRRYTRPDPAEPDEISKLKEDIEKIQASEAEIKALSFNYAAMLKEKEGDALVEERAYFASKQASLENEIKQLKQQLRCYSNKEDDTTRRLEDENKRNEFLQQQLNELKVDKEMIAKGSLYEELVNMESTTQKVDNSTSDVDNFSDVEKVKDEMASLKKALQGAFHERDRALQNLSRLKQHLLDKDLEDQEKMDEDSKVIEELRAICEQQRAHIVQLERALKVEMTKQEESKKTINDERSRSNEQIEDLQYKLANCMNALESKDQELLNLQSALGQYYAESEAKERLGDDLAMAREALAKLSESLKVANQGIEISRREKDEVVAKLSQAEKMLADGKRSLQKLEDDNSRLRHALEQSMTTVNRMSLDSDNSVDRRIVIKLLVTYFQRNHSKEVLDLMVRMLGFSEEDKQRIGSAQSNVGKVVVRGVLGLPGRLVGGLVGGNSAGKSTHAPQDNQSFADLWVDFLLKETEEREKQKASEAAARLSHEENQTTSRSASNLQASQHIANPGLSTKPHQFDRPDSDEFRMVPLAPMYTSMQTPLK